jgi:transcriptional antiterminator
MLNLSAELMVSRQTILRDITALTLEGYDIDTSRGNGGGVTYRGSHSHNRTENKEKIRVLTKLIQFTAGQDTKTLRNIIKDYA